MRPRGRGGRDRLAQAALAAVVLAGGLLLNHLERFGGSHRSYVSSGEVGDRLAVWPGSVVVHGARAAQVVQTPYDGPASTEGAWVAVDLTLAGGDQAGPLADVTLVDRQGRAFSTSYRAGAEYVGPAEPSSPVRGEVVFEVPRDALGRFTVVVHEYLRGADALGGEARVPVTVEDVSTEVLVPAEAQLEEPWP